VKPTRSVVRVVAKLDPKIEEAIRDIKTRLEKLEKPPASVADQVITIIGPNGRALAARAGDTVRVAMPKIAMREEKPVRTPDEVLEARMPDAVALGHRQALAALLGILDDWIAGARENHAAMGHSTELKDDECWTRFHPADIRTMINDAAREMGIHEFPKPANPPEK
jgi:hypothetical protein